jgi:predicted membrane protein
MAYTKNQPTGEGLATVVKRIALIAIVLNTVYHFLHGPMAYTTTKICVWEKASLTVRCNLTIGNR